jgi:hypothetical protein
MLLLSAPDVRQRLCEDNMNDKGTRQKGANATDMRSECDFSRGKRGKHFRRLRRGYTVEIHKADGSVEVRHHPPEEGTVCLDPDVREYFPDSDSVNSTLRSLITLVPRKKRAK